MDRSFPHNLRLLRNQVIEEPIEFLHASECVVRLRVVCSLFTSKLRDKLIPCLVRSGLQFDVFGIETCELLKATTKALGSPIVVALNKLGYALYRWEVFKQVSTSKYTYQHCRSVKKILSLLGSNERSKDTIIKHLNKLI